MNNHCLICGVTENPCEHSLNPESFARVCMRAIELARAVNTWFMDMDDVSVLAHLATELRHGNKQAKIIFEMAERETI